jgi:hypothetical protein
MSHEAIVLGRNPEIGSSSSSKAIWFVMIGGQLALLTALVKNATEFRT